MIAVVSNLRSMCTFGDRAVILAVHICSGSVYEDLLCFSVVYQLLWQLYSAPPILGNKPNRNHLKLLTNKCQANVPYILLYTQSNVILLHLISTLQQILSRITSYSCMTFGNKNVSDIFIDIFD